jgi:hypothetical protein
LDCVPTGFFLSVRVLLRLFRRLFLERLAAAYQAGRLEFYADQAVLAEPAAFRAYLAALRKVEWVVYAKRTLSSPTCPATRTGSPLPTAGLSPSTANA